MNHSRIRIESRLNRLPKIQAAKVGAGDTAMIADGQP